MNLLENITSHCPYCSEPITLLVDRTFKQQNYTEDCPVCCCPFIIEVNIDEEHYIHLTTHQENN